MYGKREHEYIFVIGEYRFLVCVEFGEGVKISVRGTIGDGFRKYNIRLAKKKVEAMEEKLNGRRFSTFLHNCLTSTETYKSTAYFLSDQNGE